MEREEEMGIKPRVKFARESARKLLREAGVERPPVLLGPLIDFISKNTRLTVQSWNFPKEIDGVHLVEGENVVIGYNENSGYFRKRFTIAHEMGHMLLGHLAYTEKVDFYTKDPTDIEANQFAAELLIPLDFIKKDFAENKNLKEIALKYKVSEEALGWKLYDQKII
jgi:Zn-dependent peptidase ImmA (M78 family)